MKNTYPTPAPISEHTRAHARADALAWASSLTKERHNPLSVIGNAEPIFEWLEAALDTKDLTLRRRAGHQQWINDDRGDDPDDVGPDDDPAAFLMRAAALYGAMTGVF
ncbi:hypothetical protein HD597_012903 [Nonomuraea thailandensis]|uniref:Uncharacterized protein n=1 Tax=Nonomuraea thailandensis TaxID=1188745 RepID=A0A9X2KAN5_9ACTN|nr:hypothetical protein [Nonomuraea thailandensis]MCP2365799.1 hypothetical protein [Nonomuraea thailandensis]